MLSIEDLSKAYAERQVLKGISLSLHEGLTHVLLGSSGSGKSTLLRHIMGLEVPDAGAVTIGDIRVDPARRMELARRLGYVAQNGGLFPHLTARQNITLVGRKERWPKEKAEKRLGELAPLTGLGEDLLGLYPRELSGGQQQRVGLIRALFLDPPYLLLDEPLGALDPVIRYALQNELKTIFNRLKKTVIIVTHDLAEASFFGHTITLLHDGAVLQHGTFQDFLDRPSDSYVAKFISAQRPFEGTGLRQ